MFSQFLNFFNKSAQYYIYGSEYRTFVIAFGGTCFGKGLFNVIERGDIGYWEDNVTRAFPEYRNKFRLFGYDWMGRCFAVDTSDDDVDKILVFDPSTLEVSEVPLSFIDFVNKAIPMNTNECLMSDNFIRWYNETGTELEYMQCVGYERPLFLGGTDEPENLMLDDMDEYWQSIGKAAAKLRQQAAAEENADSEDADFFSDIEGGNAEDRAEGEEYEDADFADDYDDLDEEDQYYARQADEAEEFFHHQQKRAEYIKKNVDTYLEKFRKMERKNSGISWNWCGFLFNTEWLLYRKLYGLFVLFLILPGVVSYLAGFGMGYGLAAAGISDEMLSSIGALTGSVVYLIMMIILGMFSDSWYRKKLDKLVAAGEAAETDEEADKIYKKGGTNLVALIIWLVLIGGAAAFLAFAGLNLAVM